MIVSYSNNFIFIKTRKVAGTSVEIVLRTWCRKGDICSPITDGDELISQQYGGPTPRSSIQLKNMETGEIIEKSIYNHMSAMNIRELFPSAWKNSVKFTIERHPYEKVVSGAYWLRDRHFNLSFTNAVDLVIEQRRYVDHALYMDPDDRVIVDKIFLYEQVWDRLSELAKSLGQSLPDPLPNAKRQHRQDLRPAREILTEEQKRRIHDIFQMEFALFGFLP